ncbi:MAG: primosomal protein [Caulobacterales bacterium]
MPDPKQFELEGQDLAEVFDEENITEDGRDIATSDLQRDVYDVTSADEDANEALAPDDDFDPDAADEAELDQIVMVEEDLDEPRSFGRDNAELVATDDLSAADMEAEDHAEQELDYRLEQTFPASDPVSINPGSD